VFFARKREIVVALPQDLAGVRVSEVHPIDLEISDMKKGLASTGVKTGSQLLSVGISVYNVKEY
jgi:hypothetical protein